MKTTLKVVNIIAIVFACLAIIGLMGDKDGMAGIIIGVLWIGQGIVGLMGADKIEKLEEQLKK
jgi:hypothetical protein